MTMPGFAQEVTVCARASFGGTTGDTRVRTVVNIRHTTRVVYQGTLMPPVFSFSMAMENTALPLVVH